MIRDKGVMEKSMKKDNVKIIGGGLFPVEIEIELSDEIPPPSQCDLDTIKKIKSK